MAAEAPLYIMDDTRETRRHWNAVFNLLNGALTFAETYLNAEMPVPDKSLMEHTAARFDKLRERMK